MCSKRAEIDRETLRRNARTSPASEPVSTCAGSASSDPMAAATRSCLAVKRRYSVADDTPARSITAAIVSAS